MAGTQVFLYRSTDTGAPTLNGTAGSLTALFDACLVDGYNSKAVQSITRTGSVATATFAVNHGFATDGLTWVRFSGAAQAEYNGDFQITNVTATAFDFTVIGTPATPATGTLTAKVPPLGWAKPFSGTNKAAYRSAVTASTRLFLRVNDANPNNDTNKSAFVRGYESMTDVDTGTGLFPSVAQLPRGLIIGKSELSDSTARNWVLAGDGSEFCFFYTGYGGYQSQYDFFHFGEPVSEMASDPYGCLIFGAVEPLQSWPGQSSTSENYVSGGLNTAQPGCYMARGYNQIGGAVNVGKLSDYSLNPSTYFGGGGMAYPAPHNNGLYVAPVYIGDPSTVLRATLKCVYNPLHLKPLGHGGTVSDLSNLPGRTLYAVALGYGGTAYEIHVDITGPWR